MRDGQKNKQGAGRPREFDETEVLMKIMDLFWEHGYDGVGVSDIMQVSGLARGSLYKAFESKLDMYLKALQQYEALNVTPAVELLTSDIPPLERIEIFVSAPIIAACDNGDMRGCFLCNASADKAASDADTRALVARGYDQLGQALGVAVSDLKPDWPNNYITAKAELILSVYSGLRIMARAGLGRERLEAAKLGLSESLR